MVGREPRAARTTSRVPETAKTVIVACKSPNGIVLRLFDKVEQHEPVMGGGFRKFEINVPRVRNGKNVEVTLHGTRFPMGTIPRYRIIGGYALTEGVSADFMAEWLEANKDTDLVTNQIVFAWNKLDAAESEAENLQATRSGLEPLLTDKDPRAPQGIQRYTPKDDVELSTT